MPSLTTRSPVTNVMQLLALSVHNPWAWAMFHADKDVENRYYDTWYRGWLLIHTTRQQQELEVLDCPRLIAKAEKHVRKGKMVNASIIGMVYVEDVVTSSKSEWFAGPFAYVLRDPVLLDSPIPCAGNKRFWTPDDDVKRNLRKQLRAMQLLDSRGEIQL